MILVTDSETGDILIEVEGHEGENPDAKGQHMAQGNIGGFVYHGVKAWIGPGLLEPDKVHVFVSWTDESSSNPNQPNPGRVHTSELPLPGGGVFRFLVAAVE